MKLRITIFLTLAAAVFGLASCGNATEEAAKKKQDSIAAAVKADSIHDADSTAKAVAEESMRKAQLDSTNQMLAGKWWHNRTEDANGTFTYRKDGYKLPPARGRESFTFGVDGSWSFAPIGPTDKNEGKKGSWTSTEKGKYTFTYEAKCEQCPLQMEVVELTADKAVVKY
jgi:hypothetical protein